jgi:hypothetical protein
VVKGTLTEHARETLDGNPSCATLSKYVGTKNGQPAPLFEYTPSFVLKSGTDITGGIMRSITISPAKQSPAPVEEHPNPFTSQPANDNLPLQGEVGQRGSS